MGLEKVRTDLALETVELEQNAQRLEGISNGILMEEGYQKELDLKVTKITIKDEQTGERLGKVPGIYITMESPQLKEEGSGYHRGISEELARLIRELLPAHCLHILVAGLGNIDATPDALGPLAVDNLYITRNVREEDMDVSAIAPGVMAQTGMEAAEIIQGILSVTHPDALIVVDALSSRSITRVACTIQITDTGIQPGSGVGNHRHILDQETLGIPVITIGIPTVVSAGAIVYETMDAMLQVMECADDLSSPIEQLSDLERYTLIQQLLEEQAGPAYVTPKDIDALVKRLSYTLSEGINLALKKLE